MGAELAASKIRSAMGLLAGLRGSLSSPDAESDLESALKLLEEAYCILIQELDRESEARAEEAILRYLDRV